MVGELYPSSPPPTYQPLVAVTRAKALLVIVGNPHVLGLDPLWRGFLQYIYLNGGWTGSSGIPWDLKEEDGSAEYGARVRREAEMDMSDLARRVQMSMDEDGEGDVNVDRPWKDDE
jgi:helicase MOV-10